MMVSHFWNIPGIWSTQALEFLERSLNPICIYDDQGNVIYASQQFLEVIQRPVTSVKFLDCFASEKLSTALLSQFWHTALQGEKVDFMAPLQPGLQPFICSLQFDPETQLVFVILQPPPPTIPPEPEMIHATLLADYERAIAALVRTEEKWKTLVFNSPHLFLQTTATGQILYASPAVERLLGYSETELLGISITQLIHPSQDNDVTLALQGWSNNFAEDGSGIESWCKTKLGGWVCLYLQGQRFPSALSLDGIALSGYDITDRKSLEAELQASEQQFRTLALHLLKSRCHSPSSRALETHRDSPVRSWDPPHPP